MNLMFLEMMEGIERGEKGYRRVKRISLKTEAAIPEVEALRRNASKLRQKAGEGRIGIKVCVTGPYTLSKSFEHGDALLFTELGDSLAEILLKAVFKGRDAEVVLVAVDEPVLGFLSDPLLDFGSEGREALLKAWEGVCHAATSRGVEMAFHLHDTSDDLFWSVDNLKIVESHVDDPLYSSEKTRRMLEERDKFLKASICVTEFDKLIMQSLQAEKPAVEGGSSEEKLAQVWRAIQHGEVDPRGFLESSELMSKRLAQIVDRFGEERIPYAGPECGLRSFPNYQCALECLTRVSKTIKNFRG
jgi:5-methyltetrahydropteroyltriglutamate--homocysteine methyltransferase